jgi:hypothetical protein
MLWSDFMATDLQHVQGSRLTCQSTHFTFSVFSPTRAVFFPALAVFSPSSNNTGNAASLNSSSSSERDLNLQDTEETGLTNDKNESVVPDESVVQRQNLNSHGTHSVPAQVIARLYSSHFSTRENVAAESQEIAELYNWHFWDAWYLMLENAIADADAVAVAIALTTNTAAGTTDAVASTDDAIASTDDSVASTNDADNAHNCDNESNSSYDPNDEAYDATYDDRNWRKLQREANAEVDEQHYYTRQRQGRPNWGIQDPGWHAPRAPTAHPDAKPPSNHRLQDWNVNVTKFDAKSGYTIENADIVYRLPSAPGNTVCYHPPFVPGTLEHQLHRRPISERLHVLHQLRDVLLTEEEEHCIREWGWIQYENHFLSLSTALTSLFRQRGTMSPWSTRTMRRRCAQH